MSVIQPVLSAPHLNRWVLPGTGADGYLWVDAQPTWTPGTAPVWADRHTSTAQPSGESALTLPDITDPDAVVYRLPWRPMLLATLLLTPSTHGMSDHRAADACATVGRLLRQLHGSAHTPPIASRATAPVWLDRIADPPAGSLASKRHWRTTVAELVARTPDKAVATHGELRTDHIVVPADPAAGTSVVRVLVLPGGLRAADPALDVGSMLGDLLELARLGSPEAACCATRFAAAYGTPRTADTTLWARAATYAGLKVVDHELRLARSRGVATSRHTVGRMDALAHAVTTAALDLLTTTRPDHLVRSAP